jgi:chaperone modulatory protein CbpM
MATSHTTPLETALGELLELPGGALSVQELARTCCMTPHWVIERLESGLLEGDQASGQWQFSSHTVVRARRLARLELTFDADPALAALTTDLIEEVAQLRKRLQVLQGQAAQGHR